MESFNNFKSKLEKADTCFDCPLDRSRFARFGYTEREISGISSGCIIRFFNFLDVHNKKLKNTEQFIKDTNCLSLCRLKIIKRYLKEIKSNNRLNIE